MPWTLREYADRAMAAAQRLSPPPSQLHDDAKVVELLCGLRHWADQHDHAWGDLLDRTEQMYCGDLSENDDDGEGKDA